MLNTEGKMTTPLEVAKTQESNIFVFIIPVKLVCHFQL